MILKRISHTLSYHETKISEYALLTEYNPKFINTKIKAITTQIEMMYHLNMSHMTTNDVYGVVSISYPLEKLVISIIDEKAKLNGYIKRSSRKLAILKHIVKGYAPLEQKEVMFYLRSNGNSADGNLIERLRRDIYQATHSYKTEV
ncbi:pathogenicity island protein [Staphylococcus petrasii]|uniref:pathogenicity island protein n=1 Tax=Staphylococcus petrasii TaxID=1276936 RepID=UPI000CD2937F|nr:pathogenicity island protein [Staphylococcus petrasii]PNZ81806.1 pathogenicity island protein [Staphylococcus petrasii]TGA80351.1 pathogenicity island protein [Staphylococcus petrasii]SUM59448.1 pathogenicity island protein [Staphylococcus petrasii]